MDKVLEIDRRKLRHRRRRTTKADPGAKAQDGTVHSSPQQHPTSVVLVVAEVGGIPLPTTLQHHMTIKRMQEAVPIMDLNGLLKAMITTTFESDVNLPATITTTTASVPETIGMHHPVIRIRPPVPDGAVDEDRPCQLG